MLANLDLRDRVQAVTFALRKRPHPPQHRPADRVNCPRWTQEASRRLSVTAPRVDEGCQWKGLDKIHVLTSKIRFGVSSAARARPVRRAAREGPDKRVPRRAVCPTNRGAMATMSLFRSCASAARPRHADPGRARMTLWTMLENVSLDVWLAVTVLMVGSALACVLNWLVRPSWMRTWHILAAVVVLLIMSSGLVVWSTLLQANNDQAEATPSLSPWICESIYPAGATLRVWPNSAEAGVRVVFAGEGFPPNTAVDVNLFDHRSDRSGKFYDVGAIRSDACGKFNYTWTVPGALFGDGHRSVGVGAATTAASPDPAGSCCHAETTLEILAPS